MSDEVSAPTLVTARLRLVPATSAMIDAELGGRSRLEDALGAAIPSDWPPEHHDLDTLVFWREQLLRPGTAGWWLHYALLTDPGLLTEPYRPTLVRGVGYKGPPASDGVVEVGYSVVPSWQRRGVATEAVRALIESAWKGGAQVVIAQTLEHLTPSLGVLRKLGFEPAQPLEPSVLAFKLTRG